MSEISKEKKSLKNIMVNKWNVCSLVYNFVQKKVYVYTYV